MCGEAIIRLDLNYLGENETLGPYKVVSWSKTRSPSRKLVVTVRESRVVLQGRKQREGWKENK